MSKQEKIKNFIFDPRVLISPPFTKCPKCSQLTFGVLTIHKNYYAKRCRNCMYPNPHRNETPYIIPLPKLNKKVIYLDQMAMSNMMKVLNPESKAYSKIDKIWLELFEILDILRKMQLIVCPSSDIHQKESLLSNYYQAIKKMYNLLSGGLKFKNSFQLKIDFVLKSLKLFLDNKPFTKDIINRETVFNNDLNVWQDRTFITVDFQLNQSDIDSAKKEREESSSRFNEIFNKWQKSSKTYEEFFNIEEDEYPRSIINDYKSFLINFKYTSNEFDSLSMLTQLKNENLFLFNLVLSTISEYISDPIKCLEKSFAFFESEYFKSIPEHKIASYLFAGLARKAVQGQKRPPSKGMLNDITIISNYLPFCDAMFLDNECVALLTENPTKDYIKNFNTKIFSKNTLDDFFEYLYNIKNSASAAHLKKLKEVYGEDWIKPYTSIYNK